MLSHNRFRTPPALRSDSAQWYTTGQLWIRWFLSLADGARTKEVSLKGCRAPGFKQELPNPRDSGELSAQIVERPLRGPRANPITVAE
jgi:hypothetical protein